MVVNGNLNFILALKRTKVIMEIKIKRVTARLEALLGFDLKIEKIALPF